MTGIDRCNRTSFRHWVYRYLFYTFCKLKSYVEIIELCICLTPCGVIFFMLDVFEMVCVCCWDECCSFLSWPERVRCVPLQEEGKRCTRFCNRSGGGGAPEGPKMERWGGHIAERYSLKIQLQVENKHSNTNNGMVRDMPKNTIEIKKKDGEVRSPSLMLRLGQKIQLKRT